MELPPSWFVKSERDLGRVSKLPRGAGVGVGAGGGGLYDTGATFIPVRVYSGSLLWLRIRLHDTSTRSHNGASHTGGSSPR